MRITKAYGTYLKSSDVKDNPITATISHVAFEQVGQGRDTQEKPVLHFEGDVKPLVLNRTNGEALDGAFGDTDDWPGHKVRIVCEPTTYGGKPTEGIRLKPIVPKAAKKQASWDDYAPDESELPVA